MNWRNGSIARRWRRVGLAAVLLIAAVVLAFAPARASGPENPAEGEARTGQAADPAHGLWDILFKTRINDLAAIDAGLTGLLETLPEASDRLNADLSGIEEEYRRLVTIASVSGGLPTELTVVAEWLQRLEERLATAMNPLEGSLNDLKARLEEVASLGEGTPASSDPAEGTADLRAFLKRLERTQNRLQVLRNRLNSVLAPARSLAEKIGRQRQQLVEAIPKLWQSYYLDRSGKLYDVATWGKVTHGINVLRETFALRMDSEMPRGVAAWINVLLRALVFSIPLVAVIGGSRRLAARWPASLRDGWLRLSTHSLPVLCAGVLFHFAAWTPASGTYRILSVIGTLLMSMGQMALAWDLYAFNRPDLQRRSPLWPLFTPLLAGLLLLFLNLPGGMLGGLWVLVLGVSLWRTHRRPLPDLPFPLVLHVLRGHTVVLWIAVIMALLGWGRLSILVCMAYAALTVCVQQAVGFMRLTNLVSEYLPQEGFKALISGLTLALVLPAVLVVATLATGLWILAYPGGSYLLTHVANLDVSVGKTTFNMLQVLLILSAFYVTRSVISVGRSFIGDLPRQGIRSDLIGPIQVVFTYALWGIFGLYALSALGFSLTSLAVVAGGLSVGIGFGLQNIINNFISGLLIIFGQTLREGDVIDVGGNLTGTVRRINVRSTMVETADNAVIFIPNAEFLSGRLTNWTRNGRMVRRSVTVGAAYGTDVQLVIRLLRQTAEEHPGVLAYPPPTVLFTDFASSSLDFELRFWIDDITRGVAVATDLRVAIDRVFAEHGVEMPFPQMDVHLREGSAASPDPADEPSDDSADPRARLTATERGASTSEGPVTVPAELPQETGHDAGK